ncbi:hypothetical protein RJ40_08880 [Methanofollis aquaemaris]|uniref:DUF7982 domain-containing protein n=2 Tax=Methanofollis aquaemaris TaxID=126734 RepID=A0A8A3SAU1_9EURY|nr:hypothetical protein RJ40_08880 [Methanofollis aquaemaris]
MNDTTAAGALLLVAAIAALALAGLTGRGDLTTAMLILAGFGSFASGLFLLALTRGRTPDPKFAALLPVQGTVGIATLLADLGVQGDARFFPPDPRGHLRALIPAGGQVLRSPPESTYSYLTTEEGDAVMITPLAAPCLSYLKDSCSFEVPPEREQLCEAVVEICRDVLEIAERIEATFDGDNLVVDLRGFALANGCQAVREVSPKCCTMVGCPFCSLIACIAAEGTGMPCRILAASSSKKGRNLRLIIGPSA